MYTGGTVCVQHNQEYESSRVLSEMSLKCDGSNFY